MQSVRCTEMPICSCVRTRGAPSSPRTTLLTAARAYAVLHLCIPARYVAAPKPGVWCGYIKSACGSIRTTAPALRLLANGCSDRPWFATHTRHSTISSDRLQQHQYRQPVCAMLLLLLLMPCAGMPDP